MSDKRPQLQDSVYQRLVRRVHDVADVLIEQAQTGKHPKDAIVLFQYFIAQTDRGAPVDPRVNSYIAAALAEAIRRLPMGGKAAAVDAFILLGLIRGEGGRPVGSGGKFTKDWREEMNHFIARRLAAGVKHIRIEGEVANEFDCSEDHIRDELREIVRRSKEAVGRAGESASKENTENEQASVGEWLDDVDRYALELGVTREIVEAIGRGRLPRDAIKS